MRQHHVAVVLEAPADRAVANAFLSLLELLEQPEVTRHDHFCTDDVQRLALIERRKRSRAAWPDNTHLSPSSMPCWVIECCALQACWRRWLEDRIEWRMVV